MGVCGSRELFPEPKDGTQQGTENVIHKVEGQIGLHNVQFITFQGAIKRFGYRRDISEAHMKAISSEINLKFEKMAFDTNSPWHIVYRDTEFAYFDNRHNVEKMVLIGWLLCKHYNEKY